MGFMRVAAGTIAALVVGAGLGMPPHSAAAAPGQAAEASDGLVAAPSRPKGILKGVQRAPGSSGEQGAAPQSAPYYAPSADQQPDGSSGTGHAAGWGSTSNSSAASSDPSSAASPGSPGSSGSSGSGGSYSAGSTPSSTSAGSGSDPSSSPPSGSSGRQDRDRGGAYPPPGGPSGFRGPSPHTLGAPPRHEPPRGWGLNGSGQPARQAARAAAQGAPGTHAGAPRRPEFDKPKVGERWRALREQRQGARQIGARPQGRPLQSIKRAPPKPQSSKAPGGASAPKAAPPQAAPSPAGPPEKKGKPGGKGR